MIFFIQLCLSSPAAGSYKRPVFFEVRKREGGGVVEVVVPQELRGKSEIAVFLSPQPVEG